MASRTRASLSAPPIVPEKPSFSGFLPIRAPPTLDDSEFDASSNGAYINSGSESEGFVSGGESETDSTGPLIVNPEAYSTGSACEEEEGSVEVDTRLRVMPFAQLSGYDDYDEAEVAYEMEGGENFNAVRVPSIDIPEDFVNFPIIKASDVDAEELETSTWRDSSTVNQAFITKEWTLENHMSSDNFIEQLSIDTSENFVGLPRIKAVNVEEKEIENLMSRTVPQSFAANELTAADYRSSVNFIEHDNFDVPEAFTGLPRIKVLNAEEEELEMLILRNFSTVDQSYNAKDLTFADDLSSGNFVQDENGYESFMAEERLAEVEHTQTPDKVLENRVAQEEYSIATDTCIVVQEDSRTSLNTEQLDKAKIASDELENEEDFELNNTDILAGDTINIIEVDAVRMKSTLQRKLKEEAKEAPKMGEGTSVMIGDFGLLISNIEDPKKSTSLKMNTSAHVLQEQNPQTQLEVLPDAKSIEGTGSDSCLPTQEPAASGSQGFNLDIKCENEQLRSIYKSTINSKINLNDASASFEFSDNDACECESIPTAESAKFSEPGLVQQTAYLENDLEDKLCSDCHSRGHAERGPNLGETVRREPTVDFSARSQESKRAGSALFGYAEGLISASHEQFMEQISALSILLRSEGPSSDKNCQQQPGQISHDRLNLPKGDEYFLYATNSGELNCNRIPVTSADESNVITEKDLPCLTSLLDFESQNEFKHNVSAKENEKVKKIQAISVKFLRLIQRINLSLRDPLVLKILCRLVADIGRLSTQNFVIESAKILAKKLEEKHGDSLDFSLNILVLGRSGVGKSATINSIFGETKVITSPFEPATTSVKEVTGIIQGIKIRIVDTPGLRPPMKEQAFNRKILASIKRYMKKFPLDVILYVDRVDSQTWDFNDLPVLKSITSSLDKSIWQRAILTLTHAASPPGDDPSGLPLSHEAFVAQKANLVQQLISQAAGDVCEGNSSFMCPVSLVENKDGRCLLANGLEWRSQLLALCVSLKILCEVSCTAGPQTLLGQWGHFFLQNQNHSSSLSHPLSSLMQFPAQPIFSASWR